MQNLLSSLTENWPQKSKSSYASEGQSQQDMTSYPLDSRWSAKPSQKHVRTSQKDLKHHCGASHCLCKKPSMPFKCFLNQHQCPSVSLGYAHQHPVSYLSLIQAQNFPPCPVLSVQVAGPVIPSLSDKDDKEESLPPCLSKGVGLMGSPQASQLSFLYSEASSCDDK